MSEEEINELTRPRDIVLSGVDLGADGSVGRKLRDLHIFQAKFRSFVKEYELLNRRKLRMEGT
jgi:hypothetical protein